MGHKKAITVIYLLLVLIAVCPSAVLAVEEGFTIPFDADFTLPDDDFGLGKETSETSRGTLTGQVNYQYSYTSASEGSLLNKDSILFTLPEEEYSFSVQLDYNYNLTADSRVFVSTVLTEGNTRNEHSRGFSLNEAFVSHNFQQYGNLIIGKQKLNFGNGFSWTPTGIHSSSQIVQGLVSGRWSVPYHGFTISTVVVPPLADAKSDQGLLYERVETTYGPVNVAISGLIREEEKPRLGLDFSTFLGDVELYAAVSGREENFRRYLSSEEVPGPFGEKLNIYELVSRDNECWKVQGLVGANYTIPGTEIYLLAEYYYDETGLTTEEVEAVGDAADYCTEMMTNPPVPGLDGQYKGYLAMLNSYFQPGEMGQHYLFLGARSVKLTNQLMANCFGIANLADRSGVLVPELSYALTGNTSIVLSGNLLFGEEKSEYGLSVMERKISLKTVTLF